MFLQCSLQTILFSSHVFALFFLPKISELTVNVTRLHKKCKICALGCDKAFTKKSEIRQNCYQQIKDLRKHEDLISASGFSIIQSLIRCIKSSEYFPKHKSRISNWTSDHFFTLMLRWGLYTELTCPAQTRGQDRMIRLSLLFPQRPPWVHVCVYKLKCVSSKVIRLCVQKDGGSLRVRWGGGYLTATFIISRELERKGCIWASQMLFKINLLLCFTRRAT